MRKTAFFVMLFFCGSHVYAQENPVITEKLKKKYDYVSYVEGFSEDKRDSYYSVEKGGKRGACDISGKEIVPPKYNGYVQCWGDYYTCIQDEKYGVYGLNGKVIIEPNTFDLSIRNTDTTSLLSKKRKEERQ